MQDQLFILLNVFIALILSGAIGYEREIANKPAGFRTNMMVGGVACLLFSLGEIIVERYSLPYYHDFMRMDLIRIVEAVVVGISFIGAGTILKSHDSEKIFFLTTAATILFSATVGIAIALDLYVLGVGITLIVLLINTFIRHMDKNLK